MSNRRMWLLLLGGLSVGTLGPGCDKIRSLHGKPIVQRRETMPGSNGPGASAPAPGPQDPRRIVAPGIVEPWEGEVALSPRESGWIAQVLVTEGQPVEAGQVLAVLDDANQRATLEAAAAELAEAEANLAKLVHGSTTEELAQARADGEAAQARAELAERNAQRMDRLGGAEAASVADVERARAEATAQRALARRTAARTAEVIRGARAEDRSGARARLATARARLALAQSNLERRRVVAPAAATVLQSRFHVGEFYNLGSSPLFVLGDMSRLRVRVEVDEIDAFRIVEGSTCELFGEDDRKLADATAFRLAPRMGRRVLTIESPTTRLDTRVREVFVEVAPGSVLVPGRRVWAHCGAGGPPLAERASTSNGGGGGGPGPEGPPRGTARGEPLQDPWHRRAVAGDEGEDPSEGADRVHRGDDAPGGAPAWTMADFGAERPADPTALTPGRSVSGTVLRDGPQAVLEAARLFAVEEFSAAQDAARWSVWPAAKAEEWNSSAMATGQGQSEARIQP